MNQIVEVEGDQVAHILDLRDIERLGRVDGGKPCSICARSDGDLLSINAQLLQRVPYRNVAKQFKIHHVALYRHFHRHLLPEVLRVLNDRGILLDNNLMSVDRVIRDMGLMRQKMTDIALNDTEETRDQVAAGRAASGMSRTALELHGKLGTPGAVNVNVGAVADGSNEELEALRAVLIEQGLTHVIEAAGAKLAGVDLIEAQVVEEIEDGAD